MNSLHTAVPDLLKRFVPTPYSVKVLFNEVSLAFETNDSDLIQVMAKADQGGPWDPNAAVRVKLVRDDTAPAPPAEMLMLASWPIITLIEGGTMLVLDGRRREILGFISAGVSAKRVVSELLPLMLERYREFTTHAAIPKNGNYHLNHT